MPTPANADEKGQGGKAGGRVEVEVVVGRASCQRARPAHARPSEPCGCACRIARPASAVCWRICGPRLGRRRGRTEKTSSTAHTVWNCAATPCSADRDPLPPGRAYPRDNSPSARGVGRQLLPPHQCRCGEGTGTRGEKNSVRARHHLSLNNDASGAAVRTLPGPPCCEHVAPSRTARAWGGGRYGPPGGHVERDVRCATQSACECLICAGWGRDSPDDDVLHKEPVAPARRHGARAPGKRFRNKARYGEKGKSKVCFFGKNFVSAPKPRRVTRAPFSAVPHSPGPSSYSSICRHARVRPPIMLAASTSPGGACPRSAEPPLPPAVVVDGPRQRPAPASAAEYHAGRTDGEGIPPARRARR